MESRAVKQAVDEAGGTDRALADAIGVSRAAVSKWRRGTRTMSVENALKIEAATGVDAARLNAFIRRQRASS